MATRTWIGTGAAPNDWTHPDNWSPSGVPTAGMHVYFEDSSVDCNTTTELDQSGVNLGSLNIDQSYTGSIGTASTPLQSQTPILNIGYHNGPGTPTGSPLLNIDLGTDATDITISNTGTSADTTKAPVQLLNTNSSSTLIVYKGKVEVATGPGATAEFSKITVSYDTNASTDADVFIGSGVTLATLDCLGGDTILECAATAATISAGTLLTLGSGAIATLNVNGGTVTSNSSGTIATLNVLNGSGTIDFTKTNAARTVTTAKLGPTGSMKFNTTYITITNKVIPDATGIVTYRAT